MNFVNASTVVPCPGGRRHAGLVTLLIIGIPSQAFSREIMGVLVYYGGVFKAALNNRIRPIWPFQGLFQGEIIGVFGSSNHQQPPHRMEKQQLLLGGAGQGL